MTDAERMREAAAMACEQLQHQAAEKAEASQSHSSEQVYWEEQWNAFEAAKDAIRALPLPAAPVRPADEEVARELAVFATYQCLGSSANAGRPDFAAVIQKRIASALARTRAAEREAIVAWLRDQAEIGVSNRAIETVLRMADAIDRGDHLTPPRGALAGEDA